MAWEWAVYLGLGFLTLRFLFFALGDVRARRLEQRYGKPLAQRRQPPRVSVIVPARNEERHIAECVHSIFRNGYPNFEVIVVDDQSEDATAAILQRLQRQYGARLRVVSTRGETVALVGKSRALATGIRYASGEILLFTDADCVVPPAWIATMAAPFDAPAIGCVAAFSSMVAHRWFDRLQQLEWLYNHTLARAGLAWNVPLGCFGNNLALRRSAYVETGGLEKIPYSMLTEDLALLLAVHNKGYRCVYLRSPEAYVQTYPLPTFRDYLRQHHRWVHGGTALGWKAVGFMVVTFTYWLGVAVAFFHFPLWAAVLIGVRFLYDLGLLLPTVKQLRLEKVVQTLAVIPVLLFFQVLELSLPLFLIPRHVYWKDRKLG